MQAIQAEEGKEGIEAKVDRKSVLRLVDRLARDGQIKSIKSIISVPGNKQKEVRLGT